MNTQKHKHLKRYRRLGVLTVAAVYLLILIGGIVRTTGSGMGCPDWPKCFGQWVPPTEVSQLPENYQEIYSQKRAAKNERFAGYLDYLGFDNKARQIRNDESILVEREFNKYKTWTEYINRLSGALIGLFIIATCLASLSLWKVDKKIVWLSVWGLIVTLFQGWIGSIVVSTNLMPWMITIHMLLALLIVAMLIAAVFRAFEKHSDTHWINRKKTIQNLLAGLMIVYLIQVVLGTQVREMVDVVADYFNFQQREMWVEQLGMKFKIHRSYSILVVVLHAYLLKLLFDHASHDRLVMRWAKALMALIVVEIITGVIMAYFAIPAYIQPVHLFLGSLGFGLQLVLFMLVRRRRERQDRQETFSGQQVNEAVNVEQI